jgi:hypothetical protein
MATIICWIDIDKGETYVENQPFSEYEPINIREVTTQVDGAGDTTINIRYQEYWPEV